MRHACVSMTGIGSDDASHVYIKPRLLLLWICPCSDLHNMICSHTLSLTHTQTPIIMQVWHIQCTHLNMISVLLASFNMYSAMLSKLF